VLVDVEVFATARYGYDIRCELVGEAGTVTLAPPRTVEVRRDGQDGAMVPEGFAPRFAEAYRRELQAWTVAAGSGGATGPSAWDGYAASAVGEACLRSLAEGGGSHAVELAYLERTTPKLDEAVASLVKKGAKRIRIAPLFLGAGGHIKEDLPKLAEAARARHAGVEIVLETTIGERKEITDAIAAVISKGISHQPR